MKLIEMNLPIRRGSLSSWPFFFPFVVRIQSYSRAKAELFSFSSSVSGSLTLQSRKEKKHTKKRKKKKIASYAVNESGRVKTGVNKFLRGSHARDVTSRE